MDEASLSPLLMLGRVLQTLETLRVCVVGGLGRLGEGSLLQPPHPPTPHLCPGCLHLTLSFSPGVSQQANRCPCRALRALPVPCWSALVDKFEVGCPTDSAAPPLSWHLVPRFLRSGTSTKARAPLPACSLWQPLCPSRWEAPSDEALGSLICTEAAVWVQGLLPTEGQWGRNQEPTPRVSWRVESWIWPWLGSSVGESIVLIDQGCGSERMQ